MSRFKVGDYVRCVRPPNWLTKGALYRVYDVDANGKYVSVEEGEEAGLYQSRFVSAKQFKGNK